VKAIVRRLRKLEDQARPVVNELGETLADVIRERRRRRLEAGLPFENRPRETFADAQLLGGWLVRFRSSALFVVDLASLAAELYESRRAQFVQFLQRYSHMKEQNLYTRLLLHSLASLAARLCRASARW
jgi:hypothetical protein